MGQRKKYKFYGNFTWKETRKKIKKIMKTDKWKSTFLIYSVSVGGTLVCHLVYTGIHGRSEVQIPANIWILRTLVYVKRDKKEGKKNNENRQVKE